MANTIFVSCGQYTDAEKRLGKKISELVRKHTGLEVFFAEEVQDLNGLDTNILDALRSSVAFITVLHPRGEIKRPDGGSIVRASVWIEQEIAIATYIHRVEKRPLKIIAFRHKAVGLEGIRSLLHLNPIEFVEDEDVLKALQEHLNSWKSLKPLANIALKLRSNFLRDEGSHYIRRLALTLVNDTNNRLSEYDIEVLLPADILKHWDSAAYIPGEIKSDDSRYRRFRLNQSRGILSPHEERPIFSIEYCNRCASDANGGIGALVSQAIVTATGWMGGEEYQVKKTMRQLGEEADKPDH